MRPARKFLPDIQRSKSRGSGPSTGGLGSWIKRIFKWGVVCFVGLVVFMACAFWYFGRQLPSVEALRSYKSPQVTKVFCGGPHPCAEFYSERRTSVPVESLPKYLKDAFLAAEDADFYKHEGLDYFGMLRAAVKGLMPGKRVQGASTITQQACRNILLSQERTLSRKIKEWLLTPRMEKALSKDEILGLYLNQINFGHSRYGIEEAALFYFGKRAKDLSLGEAATLAGTPQLPNRINPLTNVVKAKKRQRYVLTQMARHGFLPQATVDAEMEKPIVLAPRPPTAVGAYYAEEIRRMLVARYGEDAVLASGMRVEIAMQPKIQAAAETALREGLEAVDRRMGYQGPVGRFDLKRFDALKPLIAERMQQAGKRRGEEALIADLSSLGTPEKPAASEKETEEVAELPGEEDEPAPNPDDVLVRGLLLKPLEDGVRVSGIVRRVDDGAKKADIDLVGRMAVIPFASVGWARPRAVGKYSAAPNKMSEVMRAGDIVRIRIPKVSAGTGALEATLDQIPQVQGALVVIDPTTRHVTAMVGGYDFNTSAFNRATQAKRQPGSSFKPFLYAAALASQRFTPLTIVNDAPETIRDPYTGKTWKPQNYEKSGFEGPMTVRQALTKSKNTVSVRLIEALTPQVAIDYARRAGIRSTMPENLTLALGTGEVSVLEIANAYSTLHSAGKFAEPITLVKVSDARGVVLEEHQAAFEERIPPPVAYLATSLMKSVVEEGTATAVKELARPAAGKTGTASENRDAWFSGYTTDMVATAWVGFDNHDSLGSSETGGKAALPIWLSMMKVAHEDLPAREFEVPSGIVLARVDPSTGLLAGASVPGRTEPFLEGTEPTAEAPPPGQVDPNRFFLEDRDKRGGL